MWVHVFLDIAGELVFIAEDRVQTAAVTNLTFLGRFQIILRDEKGDEYPVGKHA